VDSPAKVSLKTWSTQPTTGYDAPNPGTRLLGFEVQIPAGEKALFSVRLIPTITDKKPAPIDSLANWQ
jgi:hypothetical protein